MKREPHQLTKDVKLLQKVALKHGDKILILKRDEGAQSRPLAWDLPGGNVEWPETLENKGTLHQEDAAREVLEESGVEVSLDKFLTENLVYFSTFFEAQKQVFSVIVGWKVELPEDFDEESIKLSIEHINFEWITKDQLDEYDFGGRKGSFIVDIIRGAL